MRVFHPVNSVLSPVQCFMMQRVFFLEIARERERFYPLDIVLCCFNWQRVFIWWTVFIVHLSEYRVKHKNCKRNKDELYFTMLYQQNAWAWISFIKRLPGLEWYRNFKPHLKLFHLAVFLSLVFTILYPYLPLFLWKLFNNYSSSAKGL